MKCPNCAEQLPSGALFCGECGQAVAPPVLAPARARTLIAPPTAMRRQGPVADRAADRVDDGDDGDDTSICEECGAVMSFADIFCGACGHVSSTVSAAFSSARDTSVIEPVPVPTPIARPIDDVGPIGRIGAVGDSFVLQFSTGESVTVNGTGLVGRNPVPEPGEYFDHVVRVHDSTRSVSKTHLEFGQQAGALWICDRFSGNGTIIREPGGTAFRCAPGRRKVVPRGTRVDIGEQFFVVS